jgi:glycosyltransferase involved in cell wall biosynthesis
MNDSPHLPLVSCLCLTKGRPQHLRRAVRCFLSQSYPRKELVVVHPPSDQATVDCLAEFDSPQIQSRGVTLTDGTLGHLRNVSIELATGEYACVWDDDDWYGPERIQHQYQALEMTKKDACVLSMLIIFDARRQKAYVNHRLWENSVFFNRQEIQRLGINYPPMDKSEDYHFVNALIKANLVYALSDPTQYVYHITGNNTWDDSHFEIMIRRSMELTPDQTAIVKKCFDETASSSHVYEAMQGREFKRSLPYVRYSAIPRG